MAPEEEEEEKQLKIVALENSKSILKARQQAEQALRKQSEWLRVTLASIGDAVISTDSEGRVTFINGSAEQLTGWDVGQAMGRPLGEIFRVVDSRTRRPVELPLSRSRREQRRFGLAIHPVLIARNGTERLIEDTAAPIRDDSGATLGTVLVFRDVTERKHADKSRALLAAIVEASEDAIVSKTLNGIIQSWNVGAERLFGYKAEEAIGQSITLIIPPERLDEERVILERLRRGERIEHFETVRVAKDGRRIDISLSVSPIFDEDSRVIGASKVARDITERKQAEAALREADQRKDEFLALLAHELRNPLAPLRHGLQILRLADSDLATISKVRDVMDRHLEHMVRLIDDLLDICRVSQNKFELRCARVPLSAAIDSAVETVRTAIEADRHNLQVSLPEDPVFLNADLTRLAQVFSNLLSNSAKYTQPGGHISLTAERQGESVVIAVRDDGMGISAEALPRIFDMFSQADRSIARATGGLGIGLALVKRLVEMHGGTVSAKSDGPGRGSTFTVQLPALAKLAGSYAPTTTEESSPAAGSGRRILVVDDCRDGAMTLAMTLTLLGNDVLTAHDGMQAIKKAEEFRPQVILMDLGMPGLNGYDAIQAIRQRPWGQSTRIIALTGWGQESDRIRSRDAGFDGHLVKPVSFPELDKMLAE
jgi:PAS domain S-box-containing protein